MAGSIPAEGVSSGVAPVKLKNVDPPPMDSTLWKEAGEVNQLFIYPIKSMRGISVPSAKVGKYGLSHGGNSDRQFMIITEKDRRMVTGRVYPRIVLISPKVADDETTLTLSAPQIEDLTVKIPNEVDNKINTAVFGSKCNGYDMGDSVAKWLSNFVLSEDSGLRLIIHLLPTMQIKSSSFFGFEKIFKKEPAFESSREHHQPSAVKPFTRGDDVPLYADGFGYLLLAENSIIELNKRLKQNDVNDLEVEETRFRPNIYVTGTKGPFEEDNWLYIRIGDCLFRNSALCGRCIFTTVDPKTGEKHADGQPLKTLKKFRSSLNPDERKVYGDSPFFGINLGVDQCGSIKVGDKIFIGEPIPKNNTNQTSSTVAKGEDRRKRRKI